MTSNQGQKIALYKSTLGVTDGTYNELELAFFQNQGATSMQINEAAIQYANLVTGGTYSNYNEALNAVAATLGLNNWGEVTSPPLTSSLPEFALDFEASSNQHMSMSSANWGAYNRSQFAISVWVKRETNNTLQLICGKRDSASGADIEFQLYFQSNGKLDFFTYGSASTVNGRLRTTATYTDTANYYHILIHFDKDNATAGDRMRMWVNGAEVAAFDIDTNPTLDAFTTTEDMRIGHTSSTFDGLIYQCAFFSGSLPAIGDVYDSGSPVDVSELDGLYSLLDVDGGTITNDAIRSASWTNNNGVTSSTDIPS